MSPPESASAGSLSGIGTMDEYPHANSPYLRALLDEMRYASPLGTILTDIHIVEFSLHPHIPLQKQPGEDREYPIHL